MRYCLTTCFNFLHTIPPDLSAVCLGLHCSLENPQGLHRTAGFKVSECNCEAVNVQKWPEITHRHTFIALQQLVLEMRNTAWNCESRDVKSSLAACNQICTVRRKKSAHVISEHSVNDPKFSCQEKQKQAFVIVLMSDGSIAPNHTASSIRISKA